jgi:hypothetical protein
MNRFLKFGVGSLTSVVAGFYVFCILICAIVAAAISPSDSQGLTFGLILFIGLVPLIAAGYFMGRRNQPLRAPAFIQNNQNKVLAGALAVYGLLALLVYLTHV